MVLILHNSPAQFLVRNAHGLRHCNHIIPARLSDHAFRHMERVYRAGAHAAVIKARALCRFSFQTCSCGTGQALCRRSSARKGVPDQRTLCVCSARRPCLRGFCILRAPRGGQGFLRFRSRGGRGRSSSRSRGIHDLAHCIKLLLCDFRPSLCGGVLVKPLGRRIEGFPIFAGVGLIQKIAGLPFLMPAEKPELKPSGSAESIHQRRSFLKIELSSVRCSRLPSGGSRPGGCTRRSRGAGALGWGSGRGWALVRVVCGAWGGLLFIHR